MPSFIFNGWWWWWSWLVPWCQWWQSPHPPMQAGTKQERSRKPDISLNSDVLLWIPRNCSCLNRRALNATVSVGLNLWSVNCIPIPHSTTDSISNFSNAVTFATAVYKKASRQTAFFRWFSIFRSLINTLFQFTALHLNMLNCIASMSLWLKAKHIITPRICDSCSS